MPCVNIGCRQQCSMLEIILFFTRVRPYGRSFDILCFRMCPSYAHCRRRLREGWLERQCRRAMKLSLVSMFSNKCLHANHKKLTCKDILISSNVSECHYFFSVLFSLISFFLFLYLTGVQRQECGCATRASSRESGIQGHCTDCGYSSPWAPRVGYQEQVWFQNFITNWLVVSDCNTLIELELSSNSRWLLVGSSSFCIQHYPCSVSLQGMLRGSAKLWRNKHSLSVHWGSSSFWHAKGC